MAPAKNASARSQAESTVRAESYRPRATGPSLLGEARQQLFQRIGGDGFHQMIAEAGGRRSLAIDVEAAPRHRKDRGSPGPRLFLQPPRDFVRSEEHTSELQSQ